MQAVTVVRSGALVTLAAEVQEAPSDQAGVAVMAAEASQVARAA